MDLDGEGSGRPGVFVDDTRATIVYRVPGGADGAAAAPMESRNTRHPALPQLERALAGHWLAKHLSADLIAELAESMSCREFAAGQEVIPKGCVSLHAWVLLGGQCEVDEVAGDDGFSRDVSDVPQERITRQLEIGEWVASSSLVLPCRQSATVRARTACVLWSLGSATFQRRLQRAAQTTLWTRLDLLRQCVWLQSLPSEKLGRLAVAGRLHCCPVGSRAAFSGRGSTMLSRPRCRYVVESVGEEEREEIEKMTITY